jgi:16S rRNA (uracil1498-N3)-methyltransferase
VARELRRLLIAPERLAAAAGAGSGALALNLEEAEGHYLRRVLRLRPGDRFAVVDGAGRQWSAALHASDRAHLEQPLAMPLQAEPPPAVPLGLAVALPRRDADVLLRMVCELGIDRLVPLLAERSVDPEPLKPGRSETILREAVEQCERLWQPVLAPQLPAQALLGGAPPAGPGRGWVCTTRQRGTPLLGEALAALDPGAQEGTGALTPALTVAIGPEGGWTSREEALAREHGWQAVSLGDTILRCSTAAVSASALLSHWRAEWLASCGTCRRPCP